jgi:hypothetical protein
MPYVAHRSTRARPPFWSLPSMDDTIDFPAATNAAPPIDDSAAAIDELAFLLATDHVSTLEKVWLLEQWRYDMLLLDVAATEGLGAVRDDGALLQQINKALLLLGRDRLRH